MGYDGKGMGNIIQGLLNLIITTLWVKHEGLGFDGKGAKLTTMKTICVKDKDMPNLACSSGEGAAGVSEGGNPLPPQPSCGRLKKGNDDNIS
jgi:hypothetical protein